MVSKHFKYFKSFINTFSFFSEDSLLLLSVSVGIRSLSCSKGSLPSKKSILHSPIVLTFLFL